uniref:SLC12A transporter C-terminal domain-containing protein n=1 Tax=Parascaris equorum TaxID=6256 RepID=A0A914SH63_PAREQ
LQSGIIDECFIFSEVNWGSSIQANTYRIALTSLLKLSNVEEHVKNYRPQILLMTGNPAARSTLLDFAYSITKDNTWLLANKIKAFYLPFANENVRSGAQHLLQIAGLGKLRPNILMLGFKNTVYRRTTKFFADSVVFNSEKTRSDEDLKSSLSKKRGFK